MNDTRRALVLRGIGLFIVPLLALGGIVTAPAAQAAPAVVVSLTFNDGLATQYRNARPVLRAHGVNGTFYVVSNWVKTFDAKYMRYYELDNLYREGDEIGGMGKDHANLTATYSSDPAADLAYKQDQVCGDFQALDTWGYHPVSFTYPEAAENTAAQDIVRGCGFTSARVSGGLSASGPVYAEQRPPANAYRLRVGNPPPGPITLQGLQDLVTAAQANGGGWLPLAFNDVCSSSDPTYATCMNGYEPVDAAVLSSFLDWVASQASEGVTVRTVREAMGTTQPPLPPRPFVVSLTFDDGLRSQFGLLDVLARHNVAGTFYINSGSVDAAEEGAMTWPQIRSLQAAGQDVGGHTIDHVDLLATNTSLEYKTRQVCDDRKRLIDQGIRPVSFAYPFGSMDATAEPIPRGCGYQSARKAGTVTSDGPIFSETIPVTENPYAIRILGTNYNGPVTLEALQLAVNQAMAHGGQWLPTLFHEICWSGTPSYSSCMAGYRPIDDLTIDAFLTWIESQSARNISVKTVADVIGGGSVAPSVAVTAPTNAATVPTGTPVLSGTASGSSNVSVRLYQGDYSTGSAIATLSAPVVNGTWTVQPATPLANGAYTVQASQTSGNATGTSIPIRFSVGSVPPDTTAPTVTVTAPGNGSTVTTATPTVTGTGGTAAGDNAAVTVRVYQGAAATGPVVQTATATVAAGGGWSTALTTLAAGTYTLVAAQADASGNTGTSPAVTFTVGAAMAVTSVTPSSVARGAAGVVLTVAGSGFPAGATAAVSGTGVTVTGTVVQSSTQLSVTVSATTAATLGARNLVVSASGRPNATCTGCLSVTAAPPAAPTVTRATPASLGQGATGRTVRVSGTGFSSGATATFSGTGVSGVVTAVSSTVVTVSVSVAGTATVGARDITIVNANGTQGTCTGCFAVVAAPRITSVTPATIRRGRSTTVTVNGTGFDSSLQVTLSGSGVTVTAGSFTYISPTRFTMVLRATTGAPLGGRSVTLTSTTTRGTSTTPNAFSVVT